MAATDDELATAFHEAGHAVVALALGRPVQRVSILPNQSRLGHCELKKGTFRPSEDVVEREMLILLGGPAAEARHTGQYDWAAAAQDLRDVRALSKTRAGGERQVERLERRMLDKAEHILDKPGVWRAAERIADELIRQTTISGRAARHLFEDSVARAERER